MSCPYISILTVARGDGRGLLAKAGALQAQSLAPERFEWIVCLDDVDADVETELESMPLAFSVKLFRPKGRVSGATARNACADRTCGSVLLFSDADVLPGPGDLAAHVAEQERGLCVGVGGTASQHDGRVRRPRRVRYWNLNAANSSVPAVAFRAVGGFDASLSGHGGELLELGYRLASQGLPFRSVPQATARQLGPDPRAGVDLGMARAAGLSAAHVIRLHPELRWRLGLHPLQTAIKRLLIAVRPAHRLERFGANSAAYERAYLEGALASKRSALEETA